MIQIFPVFIGKDVKPPWFHFSLTSSIIKRLRIKIDEN
jgi:hypothetical protein